MSTSEISDITPVQFWTMKTSHRMLQWSLWTPRKPCIPHSTASRWKKPRSLKAGREIPWGTERPKSESLRSKNNVFCSSHWDFRVYLLLQHSWPFPSKASPDHNKSGPTDSAKSCLLSKYSIDTGKSRWWVYGPFKMLAIQEKGKEKQISIITKRDTCLKEETEVLLAVFWEWCEQPERLKIQPLRSTLKCWIREEKHLLK